MLACAVLTACGDAGEDAPAGVEPASIEAEGDAPQLPGQRAPEGPGGPGDDELAQALDELDDALDGAGAQADEVDEADEADEADALAEEDAEELVSEDGWRPREIKPGDRLAVILREEGLDRAEVQALVTALSPQLDPTRIQPGQRYRTRTIDGALQGFEYSLGRERSLRATRGEDGAWEAEELTRETETVIREVAGRVERSLSAAVTASGERSSLVPLLVDLFAYDINFYTDTRKGDTFKVIVERVELDGEFLRYGRVLAAEYVGLGGAHRMFYWKAPGTGAEGYFDEDGRGVAKTFLKSPLKFTRISSQFNPKRMHPVLHRVKGHMGTDYAAPEGAPVWAAADGTITFRGRRGGAGNMVIMRHEGGLTTLYMHLSKFARGQKVGQRVKQKTVIGYVGSTGLATGPHLHFGVRKGGRYVDPRSIDNHRASGVGAKHRGRYKQRIAPLRRQLEALAIPPAATESVSDKVSK